MKKLVLELIMAPITLAIVLVCAFLYALAWCWAAASGELRKDQ